MIRVSTGIVIKNMAASELGDVFSGLLQSFSADDKTYSGYLEGGNEEFENFKTKIRKHGFSFAVRSSLCRDVKDTARFVFSNLQGECKIPFFGPPLQVTKYYDMECSQGRHYYQHKHRVTSALSEPDPLASKKLVRRRQATQRIGCPAKMIVQYIKFFPGYKVNKLNECRAKLKVMKQLKADLKDPQKTVLTKERVYILLSKETVHTHPTVATNIKQRLHPLLKKKIRELVEGQEYTVQGVKTQLNESVHNMFKNTSLPEPTNRCYFPTDRIIYNHMYKAVFDISNSNCEQEAEEVPVSDQVTEMYIEVPSPLPDYVTTDTEEDIATAQAILREKVKVMMDLSYTVTDTYVLDCLAIDMQTLIDVITDAATKSNESQLTQGLIPEEESQNIMIQSNELYLTQDLIPEEEHQNIMTQSNELYLTQDFIPEEEPQNIMTQSNEFYLTQDLEEEPQNIITQLNKFQLTQDLIPEEEDQNIMTQSNESQLTQDLSSVEEPQNIMTQSNEFQLTQDLIPEDESQNIMTQSNESQLTQDLSSEEDPQSITTQSNESSLTQDLEEEPQNITNQSNESYLIQDLLPKEESQNIMTQSNEFQLAQDLSSVEEPQSITTQSNESSLIQDLSPKKKSVNLSLGLSWVKKPRTITVINTADARRAKRKNTDLPSSIKKPRTRKSSAED